MRKMIVVLLALCFTLPLVSLGDTENNEFSIRNGITFGLTMKEVLAIEYNNGKTPDEEPTDSFSLSGLELAGIPCRIGYLFKDDKLIRFSYTSVSDEVNHDYAYEKWEQALSSKYGSPIWSSEKKTRCPVNVPNSKLIEDTSRPYWASIDITGNSEWLMPVKDGYLKIELIKVIQSLNMGTYGNIVVKNANIAYGLLSKEEGEPVWNAYQKQEAEATPVPAPIGLGDSI